MNSDLNLYISALVVVMLLVQTLFHFRKATRNLIISGIGKGVAWTLERGNRLLHALPMSPVKARPDASQNTQE